MKKLTKKELERRYNYLLLQMKIINELMESDEIIKDERKRMEHIGAVCYYTRANTIKENLELIEEFNEEYNFYNKTMNIKEYDF